jgi:serine/threonine protein kinase
MADRFIIRVYLGKHKDTGDKVALKIIKPEMMEYVSMDEIERDVDVLKKMDHQHITRLVEAGYTKLSSKGKSNDVYCIALEVAAGGELFDFISMTGAFTEDVTRYFFHQFIDALEYLHENGISHRDLKTENILLDKHFNLKVADFGYASVQGSNKTQVGTPDYMAPEVLIGNKYSGQIADIFGAGLILFMMHAQSKAFLKAEAADPYYKNMAGNRPDKFWREHIKSKGDDSYFTPEFMDLVNGLFAYNPCHRLTLSEIKNHAWFKGPMPSQSDIEKEFKNRKAELEEEQRRQKDEDPTQAEFDPSLFEGNTVHRGIGDSDEEAKDEVEREILEYDAEFAKYTQFFSTSKLEDLWNTLAAYISKITSDYKFSAEDYSVSAKIMKEAGGKFL